MLGGIRAKRRSGWQRMKWPDSISLSKLRELVIDREAWCAAIHGTTKSRTWLSNWTELNIMYWASPIRFINFPVKLGVGITGFTQVQPAIPLLWTHAMNHSCRTLRLQLCCEMAMKMDQYSSMTNIVLTCNAPVQFSRSVVSNSLRLHGLQHTRPPCLSPSPRVYSNSCPLSQWCHPIMPFSVIPFSYLQSLPASGSFQVSQLFASGGQRIGVSASTSVVSMNTQDWSPLRWTGWISLQSKGLSRVFSSTTVQKHQSFGAQLSSQSNSHIHTWPLEKP